MGLYFLIRFAAAVPLIAGTAGKHRRATWRSFFVVVFFGRNNVLTYQAIPHKLWGSSETFRLYFETFIDISCLKHPETKS